MSGIDDLVNPDKIVEIEKIIEYLPHRYPFLLIDRVIDYDLGKFLRAVKNVTFNEPHFGGHFPGHPVMPGVLVLEAMAQASGVLAQLSAQIEQAKSPLFYLVKIDKARFRKTVVPGDQLILEVDQIRMRRSMGLYDARAMVDGELVATAEILCAERSRES
jgi:3-hydroxyacyl-[acyl-carrier-protein] dehydratase